MKNGIERHNDAESQVDRRYIAALCIVSLVVLIAGVWFRPSRTPPPVPSELETLNVQLARQRLDLERRSLFYSRKAEELIKIAADARSNPDRVPFRMAPPGEMVMLVATDPTGQLVWASAYTAGTANSECGDITAQEVSTTIFIPTTLTSAVAFDFDNNLAGFVIPCGDRRMLVTPQTYAQFSAERIIESNLRDCCGLEVTGTMEVTALQPESDLAKAGMRTGDTILSVGAQPVASRAELHTAITLPSPAVVTIRRGERTRKLTVSRAEAGQ